MKAGNVLDGILTLTTDLPSMRVGLAKVCARHQMSRPDVRTLMSWCFLLGRRGISGMLRTSCPVVNYEKHVRGSERSFVAYRRDTARVLPES